jgi:glycosyltransferase involved in cell wall biosynthesis
MPLARSDLVHVAYPMRVDALDKPGGDLFQVREYIAGGTGAYNGGKMLYAGEILTNPGMSLDRFDIVHLTNLDRPVDTYAFFCAAKAAGKSVVFSPIHHSYEEIRSYERLGRMGAFSAFSSLLDFRSLEMIRTIVRSHRYPELFGMLRRIARVGIAEAQLEMLRQSDRVLVLSWKERDDIKRDCPGSETCHYIRVRNGLAEQKKQAGCGDLASRDIDVCVFGRIEARKNQLAILEALEALNVSGVFAGAENFYHSKYCKLFKQRIASSGSRYLGCLPPAETVHVMRRAKVHVSASWFEVLSLVDLEAYAAGCQVVSSRCGGTQEVLGDQAEYVDPASVHDIERAIMKQLGRWSLQRETGEGPSRVPLETWGEISEQLRAMYQDVLRQPYI